MAARVPPDPRGARAGERSRTGDLTRAGVGLGTIAAANVAAHRALPYQAHLPVNLGTAATVSLLAVASGATPSDLGLDAARIPNGVRWGLTAGAVVATAAAALGTHSATRPFLADTRVAELPAGRATYEMVVRIPLATALSEELLFRGALPALLAPVMGPTAAEALAVGLFGAWHVLPAVDALPATPATAMARSRGGRLGAVAATVLATSLAGVSLRVLARRSGSIVAPTIAHAALNVTTFAMVRRRAGS